MYRRGLLSEHTIIASVYQIVSDDVSMEIVLDCRIIPRQKRAISLEVRAHIGETLRAKSFP